MEKSEKITLLWVLKRIFKKLIINKLKPKKKVKKDFLGFREGNIYDELPIDVLEELYYSIPEKGLINNIKFHIECDKIFKKYHNKNKKIYEKPGVIRSMHLIGKLKEDD
ncbi:hypothetical protein J2127_000981 [Methanococcus voltae]|uniref:hypothetical protein n=1 Tax=Methanococcus voltae TaxID=2188 RepID=UPI001AEA9B32|nr:hypothetical protein [Methanococcus voltae]MBP2143813.1 hypothetical protein [Methanococcus voltae]